MQQSGGLLLATARRSETLIFAKGKNANKSLYPCPKITPYGVVFCVKYAFADRISCHAAKRLDFYREYPYNFLVEKFVENRNML